MRWRCVLALVLAGCGSSQSDVAGDPGTDGTSGSSGISAGGSGVITGTGGGGSSQAGSANGGGGAGGSVVGAGGGGGAGGSRAMGDAGVYIPPGGTGMPGTWTQLTVPAPNGWSVVVDPVRANDYYAFLNSGPPGPITVVKSTDYGATWTKVSTTAFDGDPWGAAIDTNPKRDPKTPPVLYTPAGYGKLGLWKSIDGGGVWTQMFGAKQDSALAPCTGYWPPDLYSVNVIPDDPPNHIVVTYHAGGAWTCSGGEGLGESIDGGKTWILHRAPSGFGESHYMVILDAKTWLAVSQDTGIWKTTTAGRVNGTVSPDAWKKVDDLKHFHGSMQSVVLGSTVYIPGNAGIKRSTDNGETWTFVYKIPGSDWMSTVVATDTYLYADYMLGPNLLRSPRTDGTKWTSYTTAPPKMTVGTNDYGVAASSDGTHWYIVTGNYTAGLWRYVE